MSKLNEREIIDIIISKIGLKGDNKRKDDDVSTLSLGNMKRMKSLILKCDMLVESTDVPKGMSPWQIARKSISACVSDLSAKGIKPQVSLISVGIPKKYSKPEIDDLAKGFQIASEEFDVKIVGGDTNESKELIIDCSMIGFSENSAEELPGRNGAKPGDSLVVSGEFGYTSSGLKILAKNAKAYGEFKNNAISSVMRPKPAQKFGISLAKYFSASMDSSDGLGISLYELARQSDVNILVDNIPSAKGVYQFARNNHLDYKRLIFCGGEEYEIVATISPRNLHKVRNLAKGFNMSLYEIGYVTSGKRVVYIEKKRERVISRCGWIHLRS